MTAQPSRGANRKPELLGIYLNDHLAGATAGVELARRMARSRDTAAGTGTLDQLARDIAEDRSALLQIITALGVPRRSYKAWLGWGGEKIGRLKPNGHVLTRSPLSSLEELEMMRLGVEGKAAGWRTLRTLADRDHRLDTQQLEDLLSRARSQIDTLEELRVRAADAVTRPAQSA
jgi:hypothetical protein